MLSRDLETSLHLAFVKASAARHEFITVEHLLLALLDNPTVMGVLRRHAVNIENLRQNLQEFLRDNVPVAPGTDEVDVQTAYGFQRVVQRAIGRVQITSDDETEVTGAKVLAAILDEKDSHAAYFLRQQRVKLSAW
ncbi:hypothetical protein FNZ07_07495 [Paraburkholderia megapolitana]|uniref:ATP-dependent Clp protease ATP-binding subunit ClpA n=1 Tax=Paraburkholderia megapolitana TaxID=420953 RepID=A0A1I3PXG4_9BURK|nr:hypothetical protein FNZ07_07495 [Paraburkholderia megapolitana]SFJ26130.1 ATP-dependent Clp protease ATP-binding subunit ClpA [Paraburkholderia megapolitana]